MRAERKGPSIAGGGAAAGCPARGGWRGRARDWSVGQLGAQARPHAVDPRRHDGAGIADIGLPGDLAEGADQARHGPCADQQAGSGRGSSAPAACRPVPPFRRNGVASGTPCASRASGATMNSQPSLRSETIAAADPGRARRVEHQPPQVGDAAAHLEAAGEAVERRAAIGRAEQAQRFGRPARQTVGRPDALADARTRSCRSRCSAPPRRCGRRRAA